MEWRDTVDIIRRHGVGPVLVVAGDSSDESMLVNEALQDPHVCGDVSPGSGTLFEHCDDWRLVIVPGDHVWKYLEGREVTIANLIDSMLAWMENSGGDHIFWTCSWSLTRGRHGHQLKTCLSSSKKKNTQHLDPRRLGSLPLEWFPFLSLALLYSYSYLLKRLV